jgi:hypothetical protein
MMIQIQKKNYGYQSKRKTTLEPEVNVDLSVIITSHLSKLDSNDPAFLVLIIS